MEVQFSVAQRYASRVEQGQPVVVRHPAQAQEGLQGRLFFISPRIARETRDLPLKARIDNPTNTLRPGTFVSLDLILEVRPKALVLPEEALVPTQEGYSVFVVQEGKARRQEVTIGLRRPGLVEIRRGLEAGQTVIRAGHISVADGDAVRIAGDS